MDVHVRQLLFFALSYLLVDFTSPLSYKLNDGNDIPAVALGTSLGHLADGNHWDIQSKQFGKPIAGKNCLPEMDHEEFWTMLAENLGYKDLIHGTRVLPVNHSLARAVQWALEAGYRHVDTAALYRVEDEVGLGVKNFIGKGGSRDDVYITTKLWNDAHEREEVLPALKKSLEDLEMDYVDLYLVHYPMAYKQDGSVSLTDYLTTWKGMEDAKMMNLTKSIGVSNFNLTQMKRLWENSKIKPAVLQIEVNPTITQDELVQWCRDRGVVVMAYSPFGAILGRKKDGPQPRADHPLLQGLAHKYNKTVPQILLRYLLDRNIVAIPRSMNKQRIKQNINILDFSLRPEEVQELSGFNSNYRLRTPVKWYNHPHFPFEKKNLTKEQIKYIIDHSKED